MAQGRGQKDILSRLSDAGEEALSRVAGSQATSRVLESVGGMRERLDDVQRKVRGLDALEKRVARLEKRVEELSKAKPTTTPRARASTTKRTTTSSRATPRKKPSSS